MEERKIPKFCRYCGSPLDPGASFCATCGVPVKKSVQNVESVTNTEVSDADRDRMNSNDQEEKRAVDTDISNADQGCVNSDIQEEGDMADIVVSDVERECTTQDRQSEEEGYKFFYGVTKDHVNSNNQQTKQATENSNHADVQKETTSNAGNTRNEKSVKCPRCNSTNLQVISETHGQGADFWKLCCCGILGFAGAGKTETEHYWLCHSCGYKFKI